MPSTQEETKQSLQNDQIYQHKVILFNDDLNTFDHVEHCLRAICKHSSKDAKRIAMEAHNKGRSICYKGSMEVCEDILEKMSSEGLTVSIE
jgi:ATP-dependent Clp protease adapter protein ClpS